MIVLDEEGNLPPMGEFTATVSPTVTTAETGYVYNEEEVETVKKQEGILVYLDGKEIRRDRAVRTKLTKTRVNNAGYVNQAWLVKKTYMVGSVEIENRLVIKFIKDKK